MRADDGSTTPGATGVAAKGLVEATASPGPELALTLDPRAKRMDAVELAGHVRLAFNQALDGLRGSLVVGEEELPSLAQLTASLGEVQETVLRSLSTFGEQINTAMAAAGERVRLDVSATIEPTFSLFEQTREVLAMAAAEGTADPEARGEGTAMERHVRAIAAGPGIETVEIDQWAMRQPAVELAEGLAIAANQALRDLRAANQAAAPVNRAEIRERTQRLRDLSTQNMQAFARAITELMDQVEGAEG